METTNHEQRTTNDALLSFRAIEKSFFGVRVLKSVSLRVRRGSVLGLVGENGAGKSTLMNILGGNLRPDAGELLLNEARFEPRHPTDAARAGIAFVHQELNLFSNLTIAENIFLTSFPRALPPFIARRQLRDRAAELLNEVGLNLSPDTLVERLPAGERQLVEIAKALSLAPKLIILDEPTTSLSARETEHLFALMQRLRERGVAMIYISHILGDVLRLCDDIVVLRDGAMVGNGVRAEFTSERMISLMVGRELSQLYPKRRERGDSVPLSPQRGEGWGEGWERHETQAANESAGLNHPAPVTPPHEPFLGSSRRDEAHASQPEKDQSLVTSAATVQGFEARNFVSGNSLPVERRGGPEALLELRHVSQPHIVRDISFALHRGEVLGISGLMGAGRSELARIIFGLDAHAGGEILLNGKALPRSGPRARIQHGLAFLTEDRRHEGLCLEASIADNLALVALRRHARTPLKFLSTGTWREAIRTMRAAVKLSPNARDEQAVKTLSGGNQQKVVIGKWLVAEPRVFILDEPTRGIDVGAKFEIYQLIHDLADRGAGVLVISSEMEELIGICDRILVMAQGEIRDELRSVEFDRERILRAALLDGARTVTSARTP